MKRNIEKKMSLGPQIIILMYNLMLFLLQCYFYFKVFLLLLCHFREHNLA